jgi:hypothetical protein
LLCIISVFRLSKNTTNNERNKFQTTDLPSIIFACIGRSGMFYYRQLIRQVWKELRPRYGGDVIYPAFPPRVEVVTMPPSKAASAFSEGTFGPSFGRAQIRTQNAQINPKNPITVGHIIT